MPKKNVPLSAAIDKYLFEEDMDEPDNNIKKEPEGEASKKEKEKDDANISDLEKNDLNYDDEFEDQDVAISVKLNNNSDKAGEIKLIPFKRLSTLSKIEDLIALFNIKPEEISGTFGDQMTLTIQSPLNDFEDEKYTIRLMDGIGEITIFRSELNKTVTKQGTETANLNQAAEKGLEGEKEKQVDLSYLKMLNYEFKRLIKDEFFTKVLSKA